MGFLGGLANVAGLQMSNIEANPEQAAVGANTPESTYAMNKTVAPTMDKHYTPTVNMMGGATQGEMQQNAAQGYSNTGPMAANAVGNAAAMYFTGGAATPLVAGQMAADRYSANNPNSTFDREYNGRINAAIANVNAGINATNNNVNASLNAGVNQGYTMSRYKTGGLAEAAKHLERQGRGHDSHLVHMTTGELKALQKMAEQHGGSLTVNPHTGLPEAGFLSSVLPMALGAVAAATGQEWAVPLAMAMSAGGEYAYTGSLTKGLMAGLSAWGGAGLESGIEGLGSATMDTSAGLTSAGAESVPTEALPQGSSEFQAAQSNLGPEAEGMTANQVANANVLPSTPNAPGQSSMDLLRKGLTSGNLGSYAMDHLGQVAAVGVPLLSGATSLFKQPTVPTATNTSTNPFGMKTIPKDANGNPIFHASVPTPPNPPYQAQYRDYVANPYIAGAKKGGLMDIPKYSGADYGSMVTGANEMQQGLAQATSPQQLSELQKELIAAGQESSKNGVYHLSDIEYAKMTPAALMKANKIAVAKGLQPVGQLGDYEITPAAAIAQADIDKAAQQQTSAKEGGLMAAGGVTDGHLGSFSDGGRLLKGPGDGVSDGIPAVIGGKQPARLADGEFVIPARIVSELGNGSTDAGAKRLYAMMDRIKHARKKSKDIAADTKAYKYLPA